MRRRYVQIDGVLYEIDEQERFNRDARNYIVSDRHYSGLRAPDAMATDISTRARHREYMKRNNLTTIDDFAETWKKEAERRADFYTTGGDHEERKQQIAEAMHKRR